MSDAIAALNWVNDAIFVSLVNTTLQITLLIALIALIIRIFHIKSAPMRYSLWLFALFAMLILPILTPFIPQMDFTRLHHQRGAEHGLDDVMDLGMQAGSIGDMSMASGSVSSPNEAVVALSEEMNVSLINPVSVAYFIWCAGALFMLCRTIVIYRKLRKLRLYSSDVESKAALEALSRLRDKLGIGRTVTLKSSPRVYIPIGLGVLYPAIILPNDVMDNGSVEELEMILAHELAHIKRFDYLVRFLQNVLKVFFFFHPLFHLVKRNLSREREHICDDWVIHLTKHRSRYAEFLVDMLERVVSNPVNIPVTMAIAERKQDIPGRINIIVDKSRRLSTNVPKKTLIALLLIGCLSLSVIGGIKLVRSAAARTASEEGQIAFSRDSSIWIMDADGKNEKQITDVIAKNPVYSPDGQRIVFGGSIGIYVMNADGSDMKQLTNGNYDDFPTWSPNGQQIAFTRAVVERKDGNLNVQNEAIYVMSSDGANLKKLTDGQPFFDRWASWSPDGREIAFQQWGNFPAGQKICIMNANGDNREIVYEKGECPVWSPDGKRIAFAAMEDNTLGLHIYVMDADGLNVKKLTHREGWNEDYPTWSPDGTKIAFSSYPSSRWDERDIYVMDADGSNIQQLTKTKENEYALDWTAYSYAVELIGKLGATWGRIKTK